MPAPIVLCPAGPTTQLDLTAQGVSFYIESDVPVCRWQVVSEIAQPVLVNLNADLANPITPTRPSQSGQSAPGVMIPTNGTIVVQLPTLQNIYTELGGYTSNVQITAISGASSGQVYITPVL